MSDVTLVPGSGRLVVTTAQYIVPAAGALLTFGVMSAQPGTGQLVANGLPAVSAAVLIAQTGSLALSEELPHQAYTLLPPESGALALSGKQPVVVSHTTQDLLLTGQQAAIGRGQRLPTFATESMDSDFFQRLDENPLNNGWWFNVVTNGLKLLDTSAKAGQPGLCISGWKASKKVFSNWQVSQCQVSALGNFDDPGVGVLLDATGGGRGYVALYHISSQQVEIYKLTGGVLSSLTTLSVTLAATDLLSLEARAGASSTLLTAYKNGVSFGNVTDSTSPYLSGQPGLAYNYANINATVIDNWLAVDLATSGLALTGYRPFVGPTFYPLVPQLALTGAAPVVNVGAINAVVLGGALNLVGTAPTLKLSQTGFTLSGSLSLSSSAPVLNSKVTIQPGVGALTVTGVLTGRASNVFVSPSAGTVALNGAAGFSNSKVQTQTGALALSPQNAGTGIGGTSKSATPFGADMALSGVAPVVGQSYTPLTQTGSLALSGIPGAVFFQVTPAAGAASFAGAAPKVSSSAVLLPDAGALSLAGYSPNFTAEIKPQTGALSLSGSTSGASSKLSIPTAALSLSGQQPSLKTEFKFAPSSAGLAFAFDVPKSTVNATLSPGSGTLEITPQDPEALPSVVFSPFSGILLAESESPTSSGGNSTLEVGSGVLTFDGVAVVPIIPAAVLPGVTTLVILNSE